MSAQPQFEPCEDIACDHPICESIRKIRVVWESRRLEKAFAALFDAIHHHCHNCKSKHRESLMQSLEPLAKLRGEIRTRESGGN